MGNEFESHLIQRHQLSALYQNSLDQSKQFEEKLGSNEKDLLKSYYSQEEMNPTKIVETAMSTAQLSEKLIGVLKVGLSPLGSIPRSLVSFNLCQSVQ